MLKIAAEIDGLYDRNLEAVWDSLLPAPDIRIIKQNGAIEQVDQTVQDVAVHYFRNIVQLIVSLTALPFTCLLSAIASSLRGRVTIQSPSEQIEADLPPPPQAFGFANSGFQDGAIGTDYDPSSLKGQGVADWNKVLARDPQRVTPDGAKIGPITNGITLQEGRSIEELFVNIMDYPNEFADLLAKQGCNSYRISLERSVLERQPGDFNEFVIEKYRALFRALKAKEIEPWVTLHHFTNPQWFEDEGGFAEEKNIAGFVGYCERMVEEFPEVSNWITFNEPGIRALEGYVRGEHPPEQKNIAQAAQVIRNLLIAHIQASAAMKREREDLNIGITHQWLKFTSFGNPIEKITAFFFTSLIHTPIFNFFKDGILHVKIPFRANVQLHYENGHLPKLADFLGVQAYGFPRVKVGLNGGIAHPGAADKVNNLILSRFLQLGFTAGSTCEEGESMQYFGPPVKPDDLIPVLNEAFSIPKERIPAIGITETGSDARRMDFDAPGMEIDNEAQGRTFTEIAQIIQKYPLICTFFWTLNRHCEWRSGNMTVLGITKVTNREDGGFSYEETPALESVRNFFFSMKHQLGNNAVA